MIYFVQPSRGGLVKIGLSSQIPKRFQQLQGSSPIPLTLLYTEDGELEEELVLHARFDHLRVRGEWFYPGKDLAGYCGAIPGDPDVDTLIEKAQRLGRAEGVGMQRADAERLERYMHNHL